MVLYKPGDRITQGTYGDGTVTVANEIHTVIDFDSHGVRTFSSPRVVLEPSSTEAPPPRQTPRKRAPRAAKK